ncbi:hypothetical protein J6590_086394 [Homalodisca vitripennis]|nr:hypothetical protein J6590_086394 [Homalodisca vitripennis]
MGLVDIKETVGVGGAPLMLKVSQEEMLPTIFLGDMREIVPCIPHRSLTEGEPFHKQSSLSYHARRRVVRGDLDDIGSRKRSSVSDKQMVAETT